MNGSHRTQPIQIALIYFKVVIKCSLSPRQNKLNIFSMFISPLPTSLPKSYGARSQPRCQRECWPIQSDYHRRLIARFSSAICIRMILTLPLPCTRTPLCNLLDLICLHFNCTQNLIKQVICWRAHLTRIVRLEYILPLKAVLSGSTDGSVRYVCRFII